MVRTINKIFSNITGEEEKNKREISRKNTTQKEKINQINAKQKYWEENITNTNIGHKE